MFDGGRVGFKDNISPHKPATIGDAMEVPCLVAYPFPGMVL